MKPVWNKAESGFTLLELMAVLAIIAATSVFALPAFQNWGARRSFDDSVNQLYSTLVQGRLDALSKSTTVKIITSGSGNNYNLKTYYNSDGSSSCTNSSGWMQSDSKDIILNSNFQISGSGFDNVCFYKDGTSSGGTFNFSQKNGGTDLASTVISIIMSTGFIDVSRN